MVWPNRTESVEFVLNMKKKRRKWFLANFSLFIFPKTESNLLRSDIVSRQSVSTFFLRSCCVRLSHAFVLWSVRYRSSVQRQMYSIRFRSGLSINREPQQENVFNFWRFASIISSPTPLPPYNPGRHSPLALWLSIDLILKFFNSKTYYEPGNEIVNLFVLCSLCYSSIDECLTEANNQQQRPSQSKNLKFFWFVFNQMDTGARDRLQQRQGSLARTVGLYCD